MLERVWRKGDPLTVLVGMSIDIVTMENSMEMVLKTKQCLLGFILVIKVFVGNAPQYCLHGMWATPPASPVGAHCRIINYFAPKKTYRWLTNT